ncbi:MAG TPA: hypothetical protein VJ891_13465, partial [Casimicrobiaceae bacterium]|nr:hypothetical protein [Casimicrobiaceae bacterium]
LSLASSTKASRSSTRRFGARDFVQAVSGLSASGALHVAVMARRDIERIMTFDTTFDRLAGVTRYLGYNR